MDWIIFLVFLGGCFAAAATGALFPPGPWYDALKKPSWTPPNWLFPVAWTVLYIGMAVAAARVATTPDPGLPLAFWGQQIALNALWSPVFFGLRRIGGALVVLALLWASVVATTILFFERDAVAGGLFALYALWVTIAGALNFAVWRLNRDRPQAAAA